MARNMEKREENISKSSIEIIKSYKVVLSLKLNVVASEMFYRHFVTG
jgi:hypothetical protein